MCNTAAKLVSMPQSGFEWICLFTARWLLITQHLTRTNSQSCQFSPEPSSVMKTTALWWILSGDWSCQPDNRSLIKPNIPLLLNTLHEAGKWLVFLAELPPGCKTTWCVEDKSWILIFVRGDGASPDWRLLGRLALPAKKNISAL